MREKPVFSIIIPTYNAIEYIDEAIVSILNQTYSGFEIIVVDGGSTDHTVLRLNQYHSKDERVWFMSEKDNGIYDAMNKGIKAANGNWLYFLGADDQLFNPQVLKEIKEQLIMKNNAVFLGKVVTGHAIQEQPISTEQLILNTIYHQGIMYHRSIFRKREYSRKYPLLADRIFNLKLLLDNDIEIIRSNVVIAKYGANGLSSQEIDIEYEKDRYSLEKDLFLKHLNKSLFNDLYQKRRRSVSLRLVDAGYYLLAIKEGVNYFLSTFEFKFIKDFAYYFKRNVFL